MFKKPNKWMATVLGIFAPPIALMYVSQFWWAVAYLLIGGLIAIFDGLLSSEQSMQLALQLAYLLTCAVHAYRLAAAYPNDKPRAVYSRWYVLLGTAIGLLASIFSVRAFFVEPFRFPSGSMQPTIPQRATLITQKWGYGNYGTYGIHVVTAPISEPLNRGDIIVFEFPQNRSVYYAKRLIGLPGDKIDYRGKKLSINGTPVSVHQVGDYFDPSIFAVKPQYRESLGNADYSILLDDNRPPVLPPYNDFPYRDHCNYDAQSISCEVPAGNYFTMGDNRDNSFDSRFWGFVPADHIVGKVLSIVSR